MTGRLIAAQALCNRGVTSLLFQRLSGRFPFVEQETNILRARPNRKPWTTNECLGSAQKGARKWRTRSEIDRVVWRKTRAASQSDCI